MEKDVFHEDERFENKAFAPEEIKNSVFDCCTFINCDFSQEVMTGGRFVDCTFINSNLSMTQFAETQLANVSFDNCKLLGCNFSKATPFLLELKFKNCILNYASFDRLKIPQTPFVDCSMKGTDLANADLSKSVFIRTNLSEAIFGRTNLKEADLSSAYGYIIDPNENNIKKARFSITGLQGLLTGYNIEIE